jgi:hypothetical protein
MTQTGARLGYEGHVLLLDFKSVQPRDLLQNAACLGHQLGPDAAPGKAGNSVGSGAHRRLRVSAQKREGRSPLTFAALA